MKGSELQLGGNCDHYVLENRLGRGIKSGGDMCFYTSGSPRIMPISAGCVGRLKAFVHI